MPLAILSYVKGLKNTFFMPFSWLSKKGLASYKWRAAAVRGGIGDSRSCMKIDFFLCKTCFRTHIIIISGQTWGGGTPLTDKIRYNVFERFPYGTFIKVNLLEKVSEFLVSIDTSFWSLNAPGYGLLFFIFVVSFTFVRVKKHQPKLHWTVNIQ